MGKNGIGSAWCNALRCVYGTNSHDGATFRKGATKLFGQNLTPPLLHVAQHLYHHQIMTYQTINIVTRPIFNALSIALGFDRCN